LSTIMGPRVWRSLTGHFRSLTHQEHRFANDRSQGTADVAL
jgi:hypothetical protein